MIHSTEIREIRKILCEGEGGVEPESVELPYQGFFLSAVLPTGSLFGRISGKWGRINSRTARQSCNEILADFVQKEPKKGRTS